MTDSTLTETQVFDFLGFHGKTFLVMGVANKKSVAYRIAQLIEKSGGTVIYSVRSESRRDSLGKLLADRQILICDVEQQSQIDELAAEIAKQNIELSGLVHSIAFADYPKGIRPFHETTRAQFLQAIDISAYSLINVCNAVKDSFTKDASVVTIGISTTRMASESYGSTSNSNSNAVAEEQYAAADAGAGVCAAWLSMRVCVVCRLWCAAARGASGPCAVGISSTTVWWLVSEL